VKQGWLRQHKLTWIVAIKIFAINLYHHSHFLLYFTTFFTLAIFEQGHTILYSAVCPVGVTTYWCQFSWKLIYNCQFSLYLNQIWYQNVPYIPFNACQIWRKSDYAIAFWGSFLQVCEKKKKKNEENEWLYEGLYFRNGWCDLLQIWYVFSPNMPAPAQLIWSCLVKRPRSYEHA